MLPFLHSRFSEWTRREGAFGNRKRSFNGRSESIKCLLPFDHFWMPQGFFARITRHILGGRVGLIRHEEPSEKRVYSCCLRVNQKPQLSVVEVKCNS
jgi:hypothetical protein